MTDSVDVQQVAGGIEVKIIRVFAAPRELVFRAWIDPAMFAAWFGPERGSVPHCTVDARVGGKMLFCCRVPANSTVFANQDVWGRWEFVEYVENEKLVIKDAFSDPEGNLVKVPDFPLETTYSVTFEDHEVGTRMTLVHVGLEKDHGEVQGWTESFDSLARFLVQN